MKDCDRKVPEDFEWGMEMQVATYQGTTYGVIYEGYTAVCDKHLGDSYEVHEPTKKKAVEAIKEHIRYAHKFRR